MWESKVKTNETDNGTEQWMLNIAMSDWCRAVFVSGVEGFIPRVKWLTLNKVQKLVGGGGLCLLNAYYHVLWL